MKTSTRAFIEVLASSPVLRPVLFEADECWAPQEPPETSLLSSFANRLLEASKNPAAAETRRAMLLVETAMESGDTVLVTTVATGFIEGLVASASELDVLPQFLAALGPSSRCHADAWLDIKSSSRAEVDPGEGEVLMQFIAWAKSIPNAQVTIAAPSDNGSARIDVDSPNTIGRVTCWETGDYHAEVLDAESGRPIYLHNGTLNSANQMEVQFLPFMQAIGLD